MEHLFNNTELPNESRDTDWRELLSLEQVDQLADDLVRDFANPDFRRWYCGVVYDFGPERVHRWKQVAMEGKEPAKLFSKYVSDARRLKTGKP